MAKVLCKADEVPMTPNGIRTGLSELWQDFRCARDICKAEQGWKRKILPCLVEMDIDKYE
jgi:hypothetical protein